MLRINPISTVVSIYIRSITITAFFDLILHCFFFITTNSNNMSQNAQKRLAASVMKCGKGKVWLDPSESRDIYMANSSKILILFLLFD